MKVKDLLGLLAQCPPEAEVVVKGYEGGVDDVAEVKLVKIKKNVNAEWYYGRHEVEVDGDYPAVFIAGEQRKAER